MAITVETGLLSLFQALAEVGEKFGPQALPPPSGPGRGQPAPSASPQPEAVAPEEPPSPAEPHANEAPPAPDTGAPSPIESELLARVDALQAENGRMLAQMAEQQRLLSQLITLQIKPKAKLGVVS